MYGAEKFALTVADVQVRVFRATVDRPVPTAFGVMTDRPAVLVEITDLEGVIGRGEIWCNFPSCGAEHRARLVASYLAPMIIGVRFRTPLALFEHLTRHAHVLALQAGEPGPLAQAIAGIDIATWDLLATRAGLPLWRFLGGRGTGHLLAYASGINPKGAISQALRSERAGFKAFKLKVGFGARRDMANLASLRLRLGEDAIIAVDANQAWTLDEAMRMSQELAPFNPAWLEEPIPADSPAEDWIRLAEHTTVPLAAGENLRGDAAFDRAIAAGAIGVIQPDICKWGGLSKGLPLAQRILASKRRFFPHYLGGGIGLLASAHLLAAAGGNGLLEIDSNPNPLREGLAAPFPRLVDGALVLSDAPGLGVSPDISMERYAVGH